MFDRLDRFARTTYLFRCQWFAALALGICVLAVGCGGQKSSDAATIGPNSQPGATQGEASLFTIPRDQLAHLKLFSVGRVNWPVVVRTTGTVDWNNDRTTPAITQIGGPVSRIVAEPGQTVTEGQPLLYVSSPDITNAIATYKKARNREAFNQRIIDRNKDLLQHGVIAQKDFESAVADFNDAKTDVQNSLQALKIFGVTKQQIDVAEQQGVPISPELAVRSPISGLVVQKLVSPGLLLQAGSTVCFLISDISTVWVQGHIFDHDLPSVRVHDAVEETNPSIGTVFRGEVEYVGSALDPATRTTPVRIVTRNPGGVLKKDMFVDAVIHTRTKRNVLVVPVSAVLQDAENKPFVYVQVQPGQFAQRSITTGDQQDGRVEVLSGLKEGEQVVSEGSIFLQFANTYQ
ncbi:MAG TPA: efflux RND transporter periplasmic adaptor subunit [Bryobacteraceae bacterium]|nr:efflux RND transporter periplasmic adaptor subunit [Bryobacteraceae bacterium]